MDYRTVVRECAYGCVRGARTLAAAAAVAAWVASAPTVAANKDAPAADATVTIRAMPPSVTVDAPKSSTADTGDAPTGGDTKHRRSRARIQLDGDPDFESFTDFMNTAPWVVGLVFLVVGSIFLTPLILLVGIIWYKLRKTRLQNEALLKLAEKGVMPPAQAVDAVVSGMPARDTAAAHAIEASAAAAEAAGQRPIGGIVAVARKRAAWSDLRKGVLMATFGLAFVFYSMIDSGSANWLGLALLFVGIGYVALWWLEDKQIERPRTDGDVDSRTN